MLKIDKRYISATSGSVIIIISLPNETPDEKIEEVIQSCKNIVVNVPKIDGTTSFKIPEVKLSSQKLLNISQGTSTHENNSNRGEFKSVLNSLGEGIYQYKSKGTSSIFTPLIDIRK
jgi:hypothetical protein